VVLRALDIYATTSLGFGDAMLLAAMERAHAREIYSWDEDFDGWPGVTRREPE
jgi:predicted nucleic acid-binding protein